MKVRENRKYNPETQAALGTRHRTKTNKTNLKDEQHDLPPQKKKPTGRETLVLTMGKLLFLIRHPAFYSLSQVR